MPSNLSSARMIIGNRSLLGRIIWIRALSGQLTSTLQYKSMSFNHRDSRRFEVSALASLMVAVQLADTLAKSEVHGTTY